METQRTQHTEIINLCVPAAPSHEKDVSIQMRGNETVTVSVESICDGETVKITTTTEVETLRGLEDGETATMFF